MAKMPKYEKGNDSVNYPQKFMNNKSGHLHHVPKCMLNIMILA